MRFAILGTLIGVLAATIDPRAQSPPLWGQLVSGPHAVGFRRLWTLDHSRMWPRSPALDSIEGTVARPIRIDIWHPATCAGPARMPLRSYVFPKAPGAEFDDLVFLTTRWDEYSYRGLTGRDSAAFDRLMDTATAVCADAVVAAGSFPLVVYSAGWFNRSPDNTILAEFLASHGFVVATVAQLNPGLWTYNFRSDASSVENQVRDLEVSIGELIKAPFVDRRHIGAMGYSTGGDVALLLQGRNPLIDAVVGLDASWTLGPGNDVESSPGFTPESHHVPILAARRPSRGGIGYDSVLTALTAAPRVVVEIPNADHGSFSDDPAQRRLLGTGTAEHQATHSLVAEAVLAFVQQTLVGGVRFEASGLAGQYRLRGLVANAFPAADLKKDGEKRNH